MQTNFSKSLAQTLNLLVLATFLSAPTARAVDSVRLSFSSTANDVGNSSVYLRRRDNATDGLDGWDSHFLASPYSSAIEAFSLVDSHELTIDSRGTNLDFTIYIRGKQLSESQGTAILSITDYQGFDDVTFEVSIYRSDDSLFGFIPNLKDYFQISSTLNLPDLDTEIYRFEVAPIPEPCTAALAGLAAAVLIGIRKTKKFC